MIIEIVININLKISDFSSFSRNHLFGRKLNIMLMNNSLSCVCKLFFTTPS